MNMKEFSARTTLSAHTLRYYEKIGLLSDIHRSSNGHRFFTTKDLEWVAFIIRLKETGMPLESILEYSNLRALGESTNQERQALLEQHRDKLKSRIENEIQHLSALDAKIEYYTLNKTS
ncbi:MerR family transcriptional regulator [Neptunomonas japonica]|uniref:MerR family transcriptional regulator n=1 Tax=Neptunomonas japonica TaxID=417574 RepID=UPI0004203863|nr:MerR family transcriptional regulator [Neptunomonas japonica]